MNYKSCQNSPPSIMRKWSPLGAKLLAFPLNIWFTNITDDFSVLNQLLGLFFNVFLTVQTHLSKLSFILYPLYNPTHPSWGCSRQSSSFQQQWIQWKQIQPIRPNDNGFRSSCHKDIYVQSDPKVCSLSVLFSWFHLAFKLTYLHLD